MARADLIKKLFKSYKKGDDEAFRETAETMITEERKKHHLVLANELHKIMNNGSYDPLHSGYEPQTFSSIPADEDRKTPLLQIKLPERYLDDLVLNEQVNEFVDRLIVEFRSWDILEANGLSPIRRVLFCGPSGCGKTAAAEVIASEFGFPLIYVRFDSVVSSLLGETAANLRKVFDFAETGQWVLFFDEFDAIGRSRDDSTEHGEIKRVVNTFLQLLDNWKGRSLVIAATNFEQALDPAIWRRFDEIIRFEKPTKSSLERLLQKLLRVVHPRSSQISLLLEALEGVTFADAERACLDIRKICALSGQRKVLDSDIETAIKRFHYRRYVLKKSDPNANPPEIDKE